MENKEAKLFIQNPTKSKLIPLDKRDIRYLAKFILRNKIKPDNQLLQKALKTKNQNQIKLALIKIINDANTTN
jgi:hypothetical protein